MAFGKACAVHVHDSFVPQESHHIWPLGDGGPNIKSNRLLVCSNGHGEIHGYLDLLFKYDNAVPWRIAQHFGDSAKFYAYAGYSQILAAGRGRP